MFSPKSSSQDDIWDTKDEYGKMQTHYKTWILIQLNKLKVLLLTKFYGFYSLDFVLILLSELVALSMRPPFISSPKNLILTLPDFLLNVKSVQTVKGLITKQDASSFHCITICTPVQEDRTFPLKNSLLRLCGTGHLNKVLHHHTFLTNLKTNRYTFH